MARLILSPFLFYCICAFFTLFFLTGTRYSENVNYINKPAAGYEVLSAVEVTTVRRPVDKPIVEINQAAIEKSIGDYEYSKGKHGENVTSPNDLLVNAGGTTIRSVVLTTWRSGSTFLGDIIHAVPGDFFHSEPLLQLGDVVIRGPPYAQMALKQLKNLLTCNYSNLNSYLQYGITHNNLHWNNKRWLKNCTAYTPDQCNNAKLIAEFCKKSPLQSMKTVRLQLKLAEQLLQDESLNVRLVLLVRDPRAVMQSRRKVHFCRASPDCIDPHLLCADMVSNYLAASKFLVKYPNTFKVIRYEDFSLNTQEGTQELFKFLGREFHPEVSNFLKTHSTKDMGSLYSTYRDSKKTPFHWKTKMPFEYVDEIQSACSEAMYYWGYNPALDPDHLLSADFNPVGEYRPS